MNFSYFSRIVSKMLPHPHGEKSFEEELDLVEGAQESEQGEIALRQYIYPLVQSFAEKFSESKFKKEELLTEGFESFHFAIDKYLEHSNEMEAGFISEYKFSTYYAWFIRQAIVTYIERNKEKA